MTRILLPTTSEPRSVVHSVVFIWAVKTLLDKEQKWYQKSDERSLNADTAE